MVEVSEVDSDLMGNDGDPVKLSFNTFQFQSNANLAENYFECEMKLCVQNAAGEFVDETCGLQFGGDDCQSFTSSENMGYNLATVV